jgi:hypothetical protein
MLVKTHKNNVQITTRVQNCFYLQNFLVQTGIQEKSSSCIGFFFVNLIYIVNLAKTVILLLLLLVLDWLDLFLDFQYEYCRPSILGIFL